MSIFPAGSILSGGFRYVHLVTPIGFMLGATLLKYWTGRLSLRVWPPSLRDYSGWHYQVFGRRPAFLQMIKLRWLQIFVHHPRASVKTDAVRTPIELRLGSSDAFVYDQIFLNREYKFEYPSPGLVIDAGANIGLATLWFANRHPQSQIIAIEPNAENYSQLVRNVRGYANVRCVHAGLWYRHCRLRLVNADSHAWAYQFEECDDDDGIQTVTLDDLIAGSDSASAVLVKIDIEGAEREVVSEAGRWIDEVATVIVECHDQDFPGCTEAVHSAFCEATFERSTSGENMVFIRRGTVSKTQQ